MTSGVRDVTRCHASKAKMPVYPYKRGERGWTMHTEGEWSSMMTYSRACVGMNLGCSHIQALGPWLLCFVRVHGHEYSYPMCRFCKARSLELTFTLALLFIHDLNSTQESNSTDFLLIQCYAPGIVRCTYI